MYQIFVVEDELLIRQSIRNTVESMKGPYAFCGEASDGEMALAMMQDLMPDILLTDIRMPFLDGFGLIRHAKAMMPWLKVVIISGYGDFEFAQKAITLGVDQYLLKPVRSAELIGVIEDMAKRIESEKASAALPAGVDADAVEVALRQQFLRALFFGGVDTGALLEKARQFRQDIVRAHYLVTVCFFDTPNPDIVMIRRVVQKTLEEEKETLFDFTAPDQLAILFFGNDSTALTERAYRLINILRHALRDICPVITTVVGSDVTRLGSISDAYKAAASLLSRVSAIGAGQVIDVCDTAQITADIVNADGVFGEAFQQSLAHALPSDARTLVDQVLDGPDGGQFDSMLVRYSALIDLMRIAVKTMARFSPGSDEKDIAARVTAAHDIFTASGDRASFRETAVDLIRTALSAGQEAGDLRYGHVITRAVRYVRENYCDPNISLISVARQVGMSAAHFSTVFSQTTGRSFIAYLTALRVDKAKELLRDSTMRLSDIAMAIGYNEPNYFSHVFRKAEGITPKEYRARNQ